MTELTQLQKKTLDFFAKSKLKDQFYWTGGTLLAVVYLHHRRSQDIDFFSDTPFSYEQVRDFVGGLREDLGLELVEGKKIYDRWDFFIHNGGEMRLEFVHYEHPSLRPRVNWEGVTIDSLDDLAANKFMALFDRNEPKDLFDIYFLLTKGGYSTSRLAELVEKKFGIHFEEGAIWSESFKGAKNLDNLRPLMLGSEDKQEKLLAEIKKYFERQARLFLRSVLE